MQKTYVAIMLLLLLAALLASEVSASTSASQTVTISVTSIDVVGVSPIQSIAPGQSVETDLQWTTNGDNRKVFAKIDHVPTGLSLKVEALTAGAWGDRQQLPASSGAVTLGTDQRELIGSVGRSAGGCKIRYTAEANPGTSITESLTIVFIITTTDGSALGASFHLLNIIGGVTEGTSAANGVAYITVTDTQ